MADNSLVTPLVSNLPLAISSRAQDSQQRQPQSVPVRVVAIVGEFVTVATDAQGPYTIPQITVPKNQSAYFRDPTQVGDLGYLVQGNYYLGGVSDQGGGTGNFNPRGNLTTMVFQPISQKPYTTNPVRDPNAAFVNGPNGVIMTDSLTNVVNLTLAPNTPLNLTESIQIILQGGAQPKVQVLGKTSGDNIYIGWGKASDGVWSPVMTVLGPSPNVYARMS